MSSNTQTQTQTQIQSPLTYKIYSRKCIIGYTFALEYLKKMDDAIAKGIQELNEHSNWSKVLLDLSFNMVLDAGETQTQFHNVHYGGPRAQLNGKKSWKNRVLNPLYVGLFKHLQQSLFEDGYYLLDISDSSKSFTPHIMLYRSKPSEYATEEELWHGYNKI